MARMTRITRIHTALKLRNIRGVKRIYNLYLRFKYRLLHSRLCHKVVLENISGVPIVVLPDVMNPRIFRSGQFLAQSLNSQIIPNAAKVLDMGTGSGVGAVFAAKCAAKVVAVDINPAAIRCTRINALLNNLDDIIEVRQGNLFEPLQAERFDVILFNPPYLMGYPKNIFEHAFFGEEIIEEFASRLNGYLEPDGKAFVLLSTMADLDRNRNSFDKNGFRLEIQCERHYINETLFLYCLTKKVHLCEETANKTKQPNIIESR